MTDTAELSKEEISINMQHLERKDSPREAVDVDAGLPTNSPMEKNLRKKFDFHILLPTILIWLMANVDRSNMGNAKIMGMYTDLDLTGDRFNVALTTFFATYIVLEIPANIVCNKVGPRIWLSGLTFGFGLITMCTAFTSSYPVLVVLRILLGTFESGLQPGILLTFSRFYRRHEIVSRHGIKASMSTLAGSFGGLLAAGLSQIPRSGPLHTWRWIFLFEGILTMCVAVVAYILLANEPGTAGFLTEEEQRYASDRIAREVLTHKRGRVDLATFKKALLNVHVQAIAFSLTASLLSLTSLALFMPSVLQGMGYSGTHAQLMSVPPYATAAVVCITCAFISDKIKRRGPVLGFLAPLIVIGFSLMAFAKPVGAQYFGIFLATSGAFTVSAVLIAWSVDNTAGPTVRALAVAYCDSAANVGGLISTWAYLAKDAPRYVTGNSINMGTGSFLSVVIPSLSAYLWWENKQRGQGKRDHRFQGKTAEEIIQLGHLHPEFKYTI